MTPAYAAPPPRGWRGKADPGAATALVVLGLLFFWPLILHPNAVLYAPKSDMVAQHIPVKMFLVDSWNRTGARPLWCPYRFCGDSLVGDVQAAAFYPPHLLLPLVGRDRIGNYLSWLIVFHVLAAGLCAYAYARHDGLGPAGAFVAGAGYMFAGKWLLHLVAAGHYILIGLAWFPLALLCFEKALRRRNLAWATAAGAVFSLTLLSTHPQWVLYGVLTAIPWTLPAALTSTASWRQTARQLGVWIRFGLWGGAVAAALTAVQLLPTHEAAGQSTRERHPEIFRSTSEFLCPLGLIGPSLGDVAWENLFGIGLAYAMAAVATIRFVRGRARLYGWIVGGLILFAVFRGGPLQYLPPLREFRLHIRAVMLAALPLALLAGIATDRLANLHFNIDRKRFARWMAVAGFACLGWVSWAVLSSSSRVESNPYWYTLPLTFPCLFWLASRPDPWRKRWGVVAWCGLMALDGFALSESNVEVRNQAELYRPARCVAFLAKQQPAHGRVLDLYVPDQLYTSPLGAGAPLALTEHLDVVRGYNPLDVALYRDFLQFLADHIEPATPVEVLPDLPEANRKLLDVLAVRYRLQPDGLPAPKTGWRPVLREDAPRPAYHYPNGGFPSLPGYTVYENEHAFPRAFVVPAALCCPRPPHVLDALKRVDFHEAVLIDHYDTVAPAAPAGAFRPARIVDYQANRVTIEADGEAPGWLVLMDVWHPGWQVQVDRRKSRLFRANYAFRAVQLPAGPHRVVFTFNPMSYRVGRSVSLCSLGCLALASLIPAYRKLRRLFGFETQPARGEAFAIGGRFYTRAKSPCMIRQHSKLARARAMNPEVEARSALADASG